MRSSTPPEPARSRATTTTPRPPSGPRRNGWYWSGDLGYLDDDRYLFFAGRTAEWIRVDGENFPAGPIADALGRHPDVVVAVAYGVPDAEAGDQVMAALVLREGATFDPAAFARWIDDEAGIGPKWRPRWLRLADELPGTGTNKIVTRTLVAPEVPARPGRSRPVVAAGSAARPPTSRSDPTDETDAAPPRSWPAGRERFWDL